MAGRVSIPLPIMLQLFPGRDGIGDNGRSSLYRHPSLPWKLHDCNAYTMPDNLGSSSRIRKSLLSTRSVRVSCHWTASNAMLLTDMGLGTGIIMQRTLFNHFSQFHFVLNHKARCEDQACNIYMLIRNHGLILRFYFSIYNFSEPDDMKSAHRSDVKWNGLQTDDKFFYSALDHTVIVSELALAISDYSNAFHEVLWPYTRSESCLRTSSPFPLFQFFPTLCLSRGHRDFCSVFLLSRNDFA